MAAADFASLGWHVPVAVSDDYDRGQYFRHREPSSSSSSASASASAGGAAAAAAAGEPNEDSSEGGVGPEASETRSQCSRGRRRRGGCVNGDGGGGARPALPPPRPSSSRSQSSPPQSSPPLSSSVSSASSSSYYPLLLPPRSTPFARPSDLRSRSYQSALYFGECQLRGIDRRSAEEGALEVAERHRRWWVERTARGGAAAKARRKAREEAREARRRRRKERKTGGVVVERRMIPADTSTDEKEEEAVEQLEEDDEVLGQGGVEGSPPRDSKRRRRRSLLGKKKAASSSSKSKKKHSPPPSPLLSSPSAVPSLDKFPRTLTPSPPPTFERAGSNGSSSTSSSSSLSNRVPTPPPPPPLSPSSGSPKADLLNALARADGDVSDPSFRESLDRFLLLSSSPHRLSRNANNAHIGSLLPSPSSSSVMDGTWLSISRPEYEDCLGRHPTSGDFLYTLGRMAFDLYRPTHLVCSIRGIYNAVGKVDDEDGDNGGPEYVPYSLRSEIRAGGADGGHVGLRTYNIVVAFTVEPNQNRHGEPRSPPRRNSGGGKEKKNNHDKDDGDYVITRPIRGVMTNYGYVLPDPSVPDRFSIWFTGGTLEFDDCQEGDEEEDDERCGSTGGGEGGEGGGEGVSDGAAEREKPAGAVEDSVEGEDSTADAPPSSSARPYRPRPHPLLREWRRVFDPSSAPRRTPLEYARVLAARVLLGASLSDSFDDVDGERNGSGSGSGSGSSMSYVLRRPIGGHGLAYVDVLYADDELRVMRGHRDQVYVCARVDDDHGDGVGGGGEGGVGKEEEEAE